MKKFTHYEEWKERIIAASISCTFGILLIASSCSTTKKTAKQKAYEAKQARIELLKEARDQFPCDSSTTYITKTDTAYMALPSDTSIKDGVLYVTKDRIITNTIERIVTVVDRAAEQQKRDSIDNLQYLFGQTTDSFNKYVKDIDAKMATLQAANDGLKPFRNSVYWAAGGLSIIGLFFGLRALKIINI